MGRCHVAGGAAVVEKASFAFWECSSRQQGLHQPWKQTAAVTAVMPGTVVAAAVVEATGD